MPLTGLGLGRLAAVGAVIAATLMLAWTALASPSFKTCGRVQGTVAVVAHAVRCAEARSVANDYLNGNKDPRGFRCRRHTVDAAAGWNAKCTRQQAWVQIIPE